MRIQTNVCCPNQQKHYSCFIPFLVHIEPSDLHEGFRVSSCTESYEYDAVHRYFNKTNQTSDPITKSRMQKRLPLLVIKPLKSLRLQIPHCLMRLHCVLLVESFSVAVEPLLTAIFIISLAAIITGVAITYLTLHFPKKAVTLLLGLSCEQKKP